MQLDKNKMHIHTGFAKRHAALVAVDPLLVAMVEAVRHGGVIVRRALKCNVGQAIIFL